MLGQVEILEDLGDPVPALLLGHVLGEAELGGVVHRLLDGERLVDDIVLGDHADLVAHDRVVVVDVDPVEEHLAVLSLLLAGEGLEEGGLARPGGADDGEQLVAGQGEGHAVEEAQAPAVHLEDEVLADELAAGARVDLHLAGAIGIDRDERRADADDARPRHQDARNPLRAQVDAVRRAQVSDEDALRRRLDPGVVLGDERVVEDEGVVRRAADRAGRRDAEGLDRLAAHGSAHAVHVLARQGGRAHGLDRGPGARRRGSAQERLRAPRLRGVLGHGAVGGIRGGRRGARAGGLGGSRGAIGVRRGLPRRPSRPCGRGSACHPVGAVLPEGLPRRALVVPRRRAGGRLGEGLPGPSGGRPRGRPHRGHHRLAGRWSHRHPRLGRAGSPGRGDGTTHGGHRDRRPGGVAELDARAMSDEGLSHRHAVDQHPVAALAQHVPAGGLGAHDEVVARDQRVVDLDLAVGRAAHPERLGEGLGLRRGMGGQ